MLTNYMGRDLHSGNVLVRKQQKPRLPYTELRSNPWEREWEAVLTDLGESGVYVYKPLDRHVRPSYGYHTYWAPEVIKSRGKNCTFASDIFALGCLILEILKIKEEVDRNVGRFIHVPAAILDLALSCLAAMPTSRSDARGLVDTCEKLEKSDISVQRDFDFWASSEIVVTPEETPRKVKDVVQLLHLTKDILNFGDTSQYDQCNNENSQDDFDSDPGADKNSHDDSLPHEIPQKQLQDYQLLCYGQCSMNEVCLL